MRLIRHHEVIIYYSREFISRFICSLACGVALYCLLGCTVKACSGHEGANVIPNNELWTNLPGYTMVSFTNVRIWSILAAAVAFDTNTCGL